MKIVQLFENSKASTLSFDLSFLQRAGRAQLAGDVPQILTFDIDPGSAAYLVEEGNNTSFQWGPGRSSLQVARGRQLSLEFPARVTRGNPALSLYIVKYGANGARTGQTTFRHARARFHGSFVIERDVGSYLVAIRLTGQGIVEFGELNVTLDSADRETRGRATVAISGSTPAVRAAGRDFLARTARSYAGQIATQAKYFRRTALQVWSSIDPARKRFSSLRRQRDSSASAETEFRARSALGQLNSDLAIRGKLDRLGWLASALKLSLEVECYDTAHRLANTLLPVLQQQSGGAHKSLLLDLARTYVTVGDTNASARVLRDNAEVCRSDDELIVYWRMLEKQLGARAYVLPSGKLDAFTLSSANGDTLETIAALSRAHRRQFQRVPQNRLLLCNSEVGKSASSYLRHFNEYLKGFGISPAIGTKFEGGAFGNLKFQETRAIDGGPLVSVVLVARNSEATIGYALRSILRQDYRNLEVLVCDDASEDGTRAEIRRVTRNDERVRVFASEAPQGAFNARNALLKLANGEYSAFQSERNFALPSRIRTQMEFIKSGNSRCAIGRAIFMRPSGKFVFFPDQSVSQLYPDSILLPKAAFERYGPFRCVRFGGEFEFVKRVRRTEGDRSVGEMHQPLLIALWPEEASSSDPRDARRESGFLEGARRRYLEAIGRQSLLGVIAVPESDLAFVARDTDNFIPPSSLNAVEWS
jgi:hypothetical protein